MKSLKMLLVAAFSIMTLTVFSQAKAGKNDTTQHVTLYTCRKHSDITRKKAGYCSKCGTKLELSPKEKMKVETVKKYTCSMHPDVTSDEPGKCPKCNMDLIEKKDDHSDHQH